MNDFATYVIHTHTLLKESATLKADCENLTFSVTVATC